jgi:hypothetical protein
MGLGTIALTGGAFAGTAAASYLAFKHEARKDTMGAGFREHFPITMIGQGYEARNNPSSRYLIGHVLGSTAGVALGLAMIGSSFALKGGGGNSLGGAGAAVAGALSLSTFGVGTGLTIFGGLGVIDLVM